MVLGFGNSSDAAQVENSAAATAPSAQETAATDDDDGSAADGAGTEATTTTSTAVMEIQSPTLTTFTAAAIGQMVAMIGEDTRTYLQGMEQIYSIAAGKALAMSASPDSATAMRGAQLLTNIGTSQTATITFAQGTAQVASAFAQFSG